MGDKILLYNNDQEVSELCIQINVVMFATLLYAIESLKLFIKSCAQQSEFWLQLTDKNVFNFYETDDKELSVDWLPELWYYDDECDYHVNYTLFFDEFEWESEKNSKDV